MISQSKIAFLFVAAVAVAVVEGFAPVAQPRLSSTTELGAYNFFQKPAEKSPTLTVDAPAKKSNPFANFGKKKTVAEAPAAPAKKQFSFGAKKADTKKAPIKKVVAKKAPAKKVIAKKAPAKKVIAKKAPAKKVIAKKPVAKKIVAKKPVGKPAFAAKKVQKTKLVAKKKSTFKNDFAIKKPTKSKNKLTVYERVCHIN
jgi:hypothetical protein